MPSHTHDSKEANSSGSAGYGWRYSMVQNNSVWSNGSNGPKGNDGSHSHGDTGYTDMVPYYVSVKRWHRTA